MQRISKTPTKSVSWQPPGVTKNFWGQVAPYELTSSRRRIVTWASGHVTHDPIQSDA